MDEREFWLGIRQACLFVLDLIERRYAIEPRTAALRTAYKAIKTADK